MHLRSLFVVREFDCKTTTTKAMRKSQRKKLPKKESEKDAGREKLAESKSESRIITSTSETKFCACETSNENEPSSFPSLSSWLPAARFLTKRTNYALIRCKAMVDATSTGIIASQDHKCSMYIHRARIVVVWVCCSKLSVRHRILEKSREYRPNL